MMVGVIKMGINRRKVWLKRDYPYQLRSITILARSCNGDDKNKRIKIIMSICEAEGQYGLLVHYYKVMGLPFKFPSSHEYKLLDKMEEEKIIKMVLQDVPLYHIANSLNRHISTIYYACKRLGV